MGANMNPFAQMASTLRANTMPAFDTEKQLAKGPSRTERIRRLLKAATHPMTAAEIAWDMDTDFPNFGSHLVWLLLKYDIAKGRVALHEGLYSWVHAYDNAQAVAIRKAVKLLKTHGWKLTKPGEVAQ